MSNSFNNNIIIVLFLVVQQVVAPGYGSASVGISSGRGSVPSMTNNGQARPFLPTNIYNRNLQQHQQQQQQPQQRQQRQLQQQNSDVNHDSAHLFVEQSSTPIKGQNKPPTKTAIKKLQVYPGLLDETLLNQGSFSFGAKKVKFDKLKVLGNVYVLKVNGKSLRDSYLLKSTLEKREKEGTIQKRSGSNNEEIRLKILG